MGDQTLDLSGETDPTEQMLQHQQEAQQRAEDVENEREADHGGSVTTEDFDLDEALQNV